MKKARIRKNPVRRFLSLYILILLSSFDISAAEDTDLEQYGAVETQDSRTEEEPITEDTEGLSAVLEEVIVFSQKRSERLQEVPISVQAMTGEKIDYNGINNLEALAAYVPILHISKGPTITSINIRGIGSGINLGFEQSVGMYIDGIFMGRTHQFRAPFLDIARVEVLRRPQSILFGRNTIAGAINIQTAGANVGSEPEFRISSKQESFNTSGFASTDTFGARLRVRL